MKGERTTPTTTRMKTSSSRTMVVIVALLAATTIVTVGMAIPIVVKPAYAQLDDISEIGEIEIPDSDDISEKVEEITSSQSLPRLAELGSAIPLPRSPPAFAG
jgi:hypothetical protein